MAATIDQSKLDSNTQAVFDWLSRGGSLAVDFNQNLQPVKNFDKTNVSLHQATLRALQRVFQNDKFYDDFFENRSVHQINSIGALFHARDRIDKLLQQLQDKDSYLHAVEIIYKLGLAAGKGAEFSPPLDNGLDGIINTQSLSGVGQENQRTIFNWLFPDKDTWSPSTVLIADSKDRLVEAMDKKNSGVEKTSCAIKAAMRHESFYHKAIPKVKGVSDVAHIAAHCDRLLEEPEWVTSVVYNLGLMTGRAQKSEDESQNS